MKQDHMFITYSKLNLRVNEKNHSRSCTIIICFNYCDYFQCTGIQTILANYPQMFCTTLLWLSCSMIPPLVVISHPKILADSLETYQWYFTVHCKLTDRKFHIKLWINTLQIQWLNFLLLNIWLHKRSVGNNIKSDDYLFELCVHSNVQSSTLFENHNCHRLPNR